MSASIWFVSFRVNVNLKTNKQYVILYLFNLGYIEKKYMNEIHHPNTNVLPKSVLIKKTVLYMYEHERRSVSVIFQYFDKTFVHIS